MRVLTHYILGLLGLFHEHLERRVDVLVVGLRKGLAQREEIGVERLHFFAKLDDSAEITVEATLARMDALALLDEGFGRRAADDEERTRESIDSAGWMHTGDLATIDAQGYCNIVGRVKDMLIRGGENVFPREIENQLMQHPKVLDVQVFGVPDAKYGEEIAAWVILQAGQTAEAEEFIEFCRSRMAHYKTPRYLRIVREFPMTATGKPQKFQMRQSMVNELGLRSPQTA